MNGFFKCFSLATTTTTASTTSGEGGSVLSRWKESSDLKLLDLSYDLTPSEFMTVVITEVGLIPCTSVPDFLREYLDNGSRDAGDVQKRIKLDPSGDKTSNDAEAELAPVEPLDDQDAQKDARVRSPGKGALEEDEDQDPQQAEARRRSASPTPWSLAPASVAVRPASSSIAGTVTEADTGPSSGTSSTGMSIGYTIDSDKGNEKSNDNNPIGAS
ncbi:Eukaryotic translation initiation factor 2B, subunit 4 delta, 67kDa [Podila humilis]|nr:Eukaryotic translation initiation factor 2B, subunit 4 delta, 67kDa [Podila humilis]